MEVVPSVRLLYSMYTSWTWNLSPCRDYDLLRKHASYSFQEPITWSIANCFSTIQLCATGTVGVAAIGLAFGFRPHSTDARPPSNKRKAPAITASQEAPLTLMPPTTPSPLPHSASAPTTRLRKRSSFARPLSSSRRLENGRWTAISTPDMRAHADSVWEPSVSAQHSRPSTNHDNIAFEFKGNNTAKSSWLRRMSTMSSSKQGSPLSGSLTGSPSVSYSNGSTAPILPNFTDFNPVMPPRNKLVKRSSSQRALGNRTMHSTLRRPATSHQRSATLQQYQPEERSVFHTTPRSSMFFDDLQEEHSSSDESRQWQYFFRSKNLRPSKEGSSRIRSAATTSSRNDKLKPIVPDIIELPTLLLATSITPRPPIGSLNNFEQNPSQLYPSSPPGPTVDDFPPLKHDAARSQTKTSTDLDARSRQSFSISDIFPSPSPSTWKMPRSGSLRRAKAPAGVSGARRIVSAPQSTKLARTRGMSQGKAAHGNFNKRSQPPADDDNRPPSTPSPINAYGRASSSPLPPLNRLSAFEIDLPGAAPSYPTTPQSELPFTSPRLPSPPSPSMSSPTGPLSNRNRSHRPSGAISDRASTLLGSDNDNSRMLSGDEDETDFRSETVYDSTRTGATGSSHSGIRRPIETIFDESADTQKHKVVALQDLLSNDSFNVLDAQRNRIAEEDESISTPIRAPAPSKEKEISTPVHIASRKSQEYFSSPPPLASRSGEYSRKRAADDSSDEEVWAIESLKVSETESIHEASQELQKMNDSPIPSSQVRSLPIGQSSSTLEEQDSSSKPNIFAWSESPSVDKDSVQDLSPRPKTVHGRQAKDSRGSRTTGRRGPSALHLRSQSVPVAPDATGHRSNTSKLDNSWVLGGKGVSEDWDGDFEFEALPATKERKPEDEPIRSSVSSGMLVPRSIMDRQASVRGQFGHVKELTILVEELKALRQQASAQAIMNGHSAELWKEAEGIIDLATLDDEEQDFFPPRSPHSPGFDFDPFEEDSPSVSDRRRSTTSPSRGDFSTGTDQSSGSRTPAHATPERSRMGTPTQTRPRKESTAKAKSVLETIHQQRSHYSPELLSEETPQKKLPFDTTSLRDLVTRAGVVTRALKEIVRRAEAVSAGQDPYPSTPPGPPRPPGPPPPPGPTTKPDPPFSQIFQPPQPSPPTNRSPRNTNPNSKGSNGSFRSTAIAGNDNEIKGHMKMMTVV